MDENKTIYDPPLPNGQNAPQFPSDSLPVQESMTIPLMPTDVPAAPQSPYAQSYAQPPRDPNAQPQPPKKSNTVLIAVIIVAAAVVIATIILIGSNAFGGKDKNDKNSRETTAAAAEADETDAERTTKKAEAEETEAEAATEETVPEKPSSRGLYLSNSYTVSGVTIPLPDGFVIEQDEDGSIMAKAKTFPVPSDFIIIDTDDDEDAGFTSNVEDLSMSELKKYFEEIILNDEDYEDASIDSVNRKAISGKMACILKISNVRFIESYCDVTWVFLQSARDQIVMVCYYDTSGAYTDDFSNSSRSIEIR